jgi:hypothetical protein
MLVRLFRDHERGYKTEFIYNPVKGSWKIREQLEAATAEWIHWHNNANITECCT